MSVLSGDNQTPPAATEETTVDYVEQIAQAKGEQWRDPQVLAKGKASADAHIKTLEEQVAELNAKLTRQDYLESLITKLDEGKETPAPIATEENTTPQYDEEQIKSLIQSSLTDAQKEAVKQSNLRAADEKLHAVFGVEAEKAVEKRSAELGLTLDRVKEIAAESPDAFMSLMGQAPKKEASPTIPGAAINTSADSFSSSSERDWRYYQDLRRSNPKEYRKPEVQRQLLADKLRLGDRFGN